MARFFVLILAFVVFFQNCFGAGLVYRISATNSYLIKSHIVFYGSEAREPYVGQIVAKMMNDLNQVRPNSIEHVEFQITYEISQDNIRLINRIANNHTTYYQFIRLEKITPLLISSNLLCSNVGMWLSKDRLNVTTTAAHEYGHGLCLDHPNRLDFRGRGIPPLMAPRGSVVDPRFAREDVNDGFDSLDPIKRRLTNYEIKELGLEKLKYSYSSFIFYEIAKIGKVDRIYYDKNGVPTRYLPNIKTEGRFITDLQF